MLDNTLSWFKHIDNILSTMGKSIAVARDGIVKVLTVLLLLPIPLIDPVL